MICCDSHMHTAFSTDSDAAPAAQADAAIASGLSHICITDHMDPGYPDGAFILDLDRYYPAIRKLSAAYKGRLCIHTGIELGLRTDCQDEIERAAARYPWDFIIGSTHVVDGADPYFPEYWQGRSVNSSVRRYYEVTLQNIRTFSCFDVYGHIDYILRYIPRERRETEPYRMQDYADILDEILTELISRGKGIECNTAGFKYGLSHPNPEESILKRYLELGGTILTVGSDGHRPEHAAYDFKKIPALLKECGAKSYFLFEGRQPVKLPL